MGKRLPSACWCSGSSGSAYPSSSGGRLPEALAFCSKPLSVPLARSSCGKTGSEWLRWKALMSGLVRRCGSRVSVGRGSQGDSACPRPARGGRGAVLAASPHCYLLNGGVSRRTGGRFSVGKVVEWRSFRWGVESVLLDSLRPSLPVIFQVSRPRVRRGWL